MDNNIKISDIQDRLSLMLNRLHKVCCENDLQYFMLGGTMLGAIRHKGFIPWDDDADIGLPRKDYEKLLLLPKEIWEKNDMELRSYRSVENYHVRYAKLYDKNSTVVTGEMNNICGVGVDIFPIDGCGNNNILFKIHNIRVKKIRRLLSYSAVENNRNFNKDKFSVWRAKRQSTSKWQKKLSEVLSSVDYDKSKYAGNVIGIYEDREIMLKKYFGQPTL